MSVIFRVNILVSFAVRCSSVGSWALELWGLWDFCTGALFGAPCETCDVVCIYVCVQVKRINLRGL